MFCVASFARGPTASELTYVHGSVLEESQRLSLKLSYRSGPPTMAPVSSLGFGESLVNQYVKLMAQFTILSEDIWGTEAPLWCACTGGFGPNPTMYDLPLGFSPSK